MRENGYERINVMVVLAAILALGGTVGCGDETTAPSESTATETPADGVSAGCGSVRMTTYGSSDRRWCGFDRTSLILPDFVRRGMTVAIAEPWSGSSYNGAPGEACGECWQISTSFATELVMVHDLCPIEGNPICAGSYFHFDVSGEVADAIDGGGWLGEAAVRRVPCPVDGNIHVYVTSRNQWGYLQLAFFNHRFPIRTVEYRAVGSNDWLPMKRCLARWCLDDDMTTFAADAPGGVFRFTSAPGEVVESSAELTADISEGSDFDLGVQFADVVNETGVCAFVPPSAIYDDEWGGIDGVRWEPNLWGDAQLSESVSQCADGSSGCLSLTHFDGSGLHITYRHVFPRSDFSTLTLQARSASGTGTVEIAPRSEDARCSNPPTFELTGEWRTYTVDITESCPDVDWIHGFTISRTTDVGNLYLDSLSLQ